MCTVNSIVLLLTLIGHDMVFISITISLEIHCINYKTITIVTHGNSSDGQKGSPTKGATK